MKFYVGIKYNIFAGIRGDSQSHHRNYHNLGNGIEEETCEHEIEHPNS
jgi:hypothetical protein